MSTLSSTLRLFAPKLPQKLHKSFPTPFLSFRPLSSSISFQRLPKLPLHQPIKSQQQQQQQQELESDLTLLPQNLQDIITLFQSVQEPKAKYHQLLHYGSKLPPLDPQYKTDEHRVRGCVSRVWVRAFPDPDEPSAVRFETDSDSALTKGLAALLVMGLSGAPATTIARVPPEFVHLLGLRQSLTPSRNNGFLNMLKLMQQKALQLHRYGVSESGVSDSGGVDGISEKKDSILGGGKRVGVEGNSVIGEVSDANGSGSLVSNGALEAKEVDMDGVGGAPEEKVTILGSKGDGMGGYSAIGDVSGGANGGGVSGRGQRIRERLERELSPVELEVEDISHLHAGHAGVRGNSGGETHFNVRVVSKEFEGKSMVKRHRLVYDLLKEELQSGLHALSIVAKTPTEAHNS